MNASDDLRFSRAGARTGELAKAHATLARIRALVSGPLEDPQSDEAVTIRQIRTELGVPTEQAQHVLVVETNDPGMTSEQMADAVLDALHEMGNHDVTHVCVADWITS